MKLFFFLFFFYVCFIEPCDEDDGSEAPRSRERMCFRKEVLMMMAVEVFASVCQTVLILYSLRLYLGPLFFSKGSFNKYMTRLA